MKKRPKSKPTFTVGFAVRLWIEREFTGESLETVLTEVRKTAPGDLVDMCDGVTVTDSNVAVVSIYDCAALDKVTD